MPAPLLIPLIMAGISGVSKLAAHQQAKKEADKKRDFANNMMFESRVDKELAGERPTMKMPQGMKDYSTFMDVNRRQAMPGYDLMVGNLEQAGATTRGEAANLSGADAAAVLLGEGQDRMRGLRAISLDAARYGQQQNMAYAQSLQQQAPWQQMMWEQNALAPWDIARNEAQGKWNVGAQMGFQAGDESAAAGIMGNNMFRQGVWGQTQNPYSPYNQMMQGWGQNQGQGSIGGASLQAPQNYMNSAQAPLNYTPQPTFLPGMND